MSFKRFDPQDIVISAESVTAPVWSSGAVTLSSFYTSSTQVAGASGAYYYNVYDLDPSGSTAKLQFAIAYGDKGGSGSLDFNSAVTGSSPSKTVYGQYRSLVLGDEESDFIFGNTTGSHIYVLNIDRARYKEKLLPGTLDLLLQNGEEYLRLTDNSKVATSTVFTDAGRKFDLVSGSLGSVYTDVDTNGHSKASGSYGMFLPDIGTLILNGKALDGLGQAGAENAGGITLDTFREPNTEGSGSEKLYNALVSGSSFKLNSEETVSSNFVFVRARNAEFNYSSNPSAITGSGELRHNVMINNPQSFVTSVGLYNDNNDLLATAKLSRPLLKDFTKEALVRIKLDF